ncbi:hypothetical protein PROFUN_11127 [Planoprotostelium fungivorum]|uniref:Secreted protein n=1 Tax=Planoprotostelium fungivorum TaxID=1890364 RepID=A0A2P6NAT4_9EUKA|nr:hypothetical protein PROFUN_11127 [Planoprotostelium fungivorum]
MKKKKTLLQLLSLLCFGSFTPSKRLILYSSATHFHRATRPYRIIRANKEVACHTLEVLSLQALPPALLVGFVTRSHGIMNGQMIFITVIFKNNSEAI